MRLEAIPCRYVAEARFLDISRHSPHSRVVSAIVRSFGGRHNTFSNPGCGDFVKVDCTACHPVALLASEALLRVGLSAGAKVLGLNSNRSMLPFCEPSHLLRTTVLVICALLAAGTAGAQEPAGLSRAQVYGRVEALTALGRRMFVDPSLSASGKMSCSSCHSPLDAFGPPNALSVQLGGRDLQQSGMRAVPSLKYLQATPQFTEHFFDSDDAAAMRAILAFARDMGIAVIAQGVETEQQSNLLKQTDSATQAQGFHFSKAVNAKKAGELLRTGSIGTAKSIREASKVEG